MMGNRTRERKGGFKTGGGDEAAGQALPSPPPKEPGPSCAEADRRGSQAEEVPDRNGRGGVLTVTGDIVYVTTSSGHLIAIADTRVRPPAGHQCTDEFINPGSVGPGWKAVCRAHGYRVVRSPRILKDVALPDGVDAANLRSEPAFADGNVYVATSGGHVYAVWPQ